MRYVICFPRHVGQEPHCLYALSLSGFWQTVANPTEKNIINVDLVLIYIPELKLLSHTYCWGVYTAASTTGQPFPQLYHTWQLHCRRPPFQHLNIGTKLWNQQPPLHAVSLSHCVSDTETPSLLKKEVKKKKQTQNLVPVTHLSLFAFCIIMINKIFSSFSIVTSFISLPETGHTILLLITFNIYFKHLIYQIYTYKHYLTNTITMSFTDSVQKQVQQCIHLIGISPKQHSQFTECLHSHLVPRIWIQISTAKLFPQFI